MLCYGIRPCQWACIKCKEKDMKTSFEFKNSINNKTVNNYKQLEMCQPPPPTHAPTKFCRTQI